jgi:hypothetical protein
MEEADSSVSRVYSGAGQTRAEAILVSANEESMNSSRSAAVHKCGASLRKAGVLRA